MRTLSLTYHYVSMSSRHQHGRAQNLVVEIKCKLQLTVALTLTSLEQRAVRFLALASEEGCKGNQCSPLTGLDSCARGLNLSLGCISIEGRLAMKMERCLAIKTTNNTGNSHARRGNAVVCTCRQGTIVEHLMNLAAHPTRPPRPSPVGRPEQTRGRLLAAAGPNSVPGCPMSFHVSHP